MRRRDLLMAAMAYGTGLAPWASCHAQTYPTRPVRVIVGLSAGGPTDITGRLIAQWLSERLERQFVVENRPGAGSNIAAEVVVNAPPDGYTLLVLGATNAINATLYDKLNFNLIRDIAPVSGIIRVPLVMMVNPSLPAKTLPEFINYAETNPGKISMGSGGNGTTTHVAGELLKMMTGINIVHVPYRGGAPMIVDLLGGRVQFTFDPMPSAIEYVRSGKLRPLAITAAVRSKPLPDLPTMAEVLPGYEASTWYGIGAPRNTPPEIIGKLNVEINAAFTDPKMAARLADLGGTTLPGSPVEFGRFVADETEKWGKVVKFSGAKPG
jgi:tripartite-type tricarboxylate transporter receptor subunit TctC